MILEIRHLRLVAAIAEHGTLTRAGRELSLTQSALSHQLLTLERRLGAPLFHRLGKRMIPTAAGARLVSAAQDALPHLRAAEEEMLRLAAGQEAILRLSTQCYTCYHWLPRLLTPYRRQFPRVEVRIVAEATRRPLDALLAGEIDLAIVSAPRADDRLTYVPLFRDEVVLIVPAGHPLAARPYVSAPELADETLFLYAMPLETSSFMRDILEPAGVTPRRIVQIQLTEGILELVKAGAGVSPLARWAVAPHLGPALAAVRITRSGYHRRWSAAMIRQEPMPSHLTAFVHGLRHGPSGSADGERPASAAAPKPTPRRRQARTP